MEKMPFTSVYKNKCVKPLFKKFTSGEQKRLEKWKEIVK